MASHFNIYVNGTVKRFAVATHEQAITLAWTGVSPKTGDECVTAPARARMGIKWVFDGGWTRKGGVPVADLEPRKAKPLGPNRFYTNLATISGEHGPELRTVAGEHRALAMSAEMSPAERSVLFAEALVYEALANLADARGRLPP